MLSQRLVRAIEDHAEGLTAGLLDELGRSSRTRAYHRLSRAELHDRAYEVYRNLGRWLEARTGAEVEAVYSEVGRRRRAEGIPLADVVWAVALTRRHLEHYILSAGLVTSALDLYQEEELNLLVKQFFEEALYHTVRGYEAAVQETVGTSAPDRSAMTRA
jgi:hypothetical protein